jgi:glycerate kinase
MGILEVLPDCEVVEVNVADGGEGTVGAIVQALQGEMITTEVKDPLGRSIRATYGLAGKMAIIEMAAASGLPLLLEEERNPMKTSTYGTGELIMDAIGRGCEHLLVGIGGSATNDAGTGMLQAMGYRFYDVHDNLITRCTGETLQHIARIDDSQVDKRVANVRFTIACDVDTPFCGPHGAAAVFAPQKGADASMIALLEEGMQSFAAVIQSKYGLDVRSIAGSGAAGGMGGAFYAFVPSTLKKGIEMVLDAIGFDRLIANADLVITGEGKIDYQTAKGKTAAGVLARAKRQNVPVVAIGGGVEWCEALDKMGFSAIYQTSEANVPLEQAMQHEYASARVKEVAKAIVKAML